MLLLLRLSGTGADLCLRDWQGTVVVVMVEVRARLKDRKYEEDASEVYWPLIESLSFPCSVFNQPRPRAALGQSLAYFPAATHPRFAEYGTDHM